MILRIGCLFLIPFPSISKLRMVIGYLLSSAGVDIPPISQFDNIFGNNFLVLNVLFTSISKSWGHDLESEKMSKSPFHDLARTAPYLAG